MIGRFVLSLAAALSSIRFASGSVATYVGSVDVGDVGHIGSSALDADNDKTVVSGSGSDIWGNTDEFHYRYYNFTGDATVTCLLEKVVGSNNYWRKSGIMFRASLDGGSPNSAILLSMDRILHQTRWSQDAYTSSTNDRYQKAKVWLRLVKEGDTVTSYVKRDGDYDYMKYYSTEVPNLGSSYLIGLAVTSHDDNLVSTATFSNFIIEENHAFSLTTDMHEKVTTIGTYYNNIWVQQVKQGLWLLGAAGEDGIGVGPSDTLAFLDQPSGLLHGNKNITMHLEKLGRVNAKTKGGLMIRPVRDPASPFVGLLVSSDSGLTAFWRQAAGGPTQKKNVGVWKEDVELRLSVDASANSVDCHYKHASADAWYTLVKLKNVGFTNGGYYVGPAVSSNDKYGRAELTHGEVDIVDF